MTILLIILLVGLLFLRRLMSQTFVNLVMTLGGSLNQAIWFYAIATLPGVLLHEVAHFLVAALFGLATGKIEMLPRMSTDGGVEMGSVQVEKKDPFRLSIVGLAPLLFGLPIVIWLSHLVVPDGLASLVTSPQALVMWWLTFPNWLILYLLTTIALHMFPSNRDMASWPIVAVFLVFLIGLASWLGLRWSTSSRFITGLYAQIYPLVIGLSVAIGVIIFVWLLMKITTLGVTRFRRARVQ